MILSAVRVKRALYSSTGVFAAAVVGLAVAPLFTPSHSWRPPTPFAGAQLCNPYQDASPDSAASWFRANFHAHSSRFEGHQAPCDVVAAYHQRGYAVAEVSDHGLLTDTSACNASYIPTYEHGTNLDLVHFTAIGVTHAQLDRYPLWQDVDQKQATIDDLRADGAFVVVNHPCFKHSFKPDDFSKLDGYQAVEIQTRYCHDSSGWDDALTAGRAVWCFTGDDNHDTRSVWTGYRYLYVDAPSTEPADVMAALRGGRFVCGWKQDDATDDVVPYPRSLQVHGDLVSLQTSVKASSIRWIGAGGKLLRETANADADEMRIGDEPYVRVEVATPSQKVYYQPIRRCGQAVAGK